MLPILDTLQNGSKEFNTGTLRIHGDVVEFKDSRNRLAKVYRVSNISSLVVVERPIPWLFIIPAACSFFLSFLIPKLGLIATIPSTLIFSFLVFMFYAQNEKSKMEVALNSGGHTFIVSNDTNFLRAIAEAIRDKMNDSSSRREITVNIDNKQINVAGDLRNSGVINNGTGNSNNIQATSPPSDADEESTPTPHPSQPPRVRPSGVRRGESGAPPNARVGKPAGSPQAETSALSLKRTADALERTPPDSEPTEHPSEKTQIGPPPTSTTRSRQARPKPSSEEN